MMSRTVCVYFTKTELEALSAEIIAGTYESDSDNYLVHQDGGEPNLVRPESFSGVILVKYEKNKGKYQEKKSVLKVLQSLRSRIEEDGMAPRAVHLHMPRISTSRSNYAIRFCRDVFPLAEFDVRIIPHGLVSVAINPLGFREMLRYMKRKWHPVHLLLPGLSYTLPKGDLIGGLDPRVGRVYTFAGMSAPFPKEKIYELVGARDYLLNAPSSPEAKMAIVVGQPLVKNGNMAREKMSVVTTEIRRWLEDNGYENIYYSKHPRSGDLLDLFHGDYEILDQQGAIEVLLCKMQPQVVISCYSTALATGRAILGDGIQALSFGLEHTINTPKEELSEFFHKVGVQIL